MKFPQAQSVTVHDDLAALSAVAAQRIAALAQQAIVERGIFRIALAGGETPRRCYEYLRGVDVEWDKVQVYFGDERCLPRGDAQRNDSMARAALLDHVAIAADDVHAIPAELGASKAAQDYAAVLAQPLDLVLLGMGEDGHTASLFPGNVALQSGDHVVAVFDAPKPPPERVSLGMSVLNAARRKMFLVAGSGKKEALQRIARGEPLPAASVMDAEWHVDRAAWPEVD
jgi:6-phosphogluconolactonase